jgi:hypothetical protein
MYSLYLSKIMELLKLLLNLEKISLKTLELITYFDKIFSNFKNYQFHFMNY